MAAWTAVILNENLAEAATLSGGSYSVSLPLTNLQETTRDTSIVARTTDATNASTQIIADLGSATLFGGVAVCNGNWTLDSQYKIQISNTSDFSVIDYDSGWNTFPGFVVDPGDLDPSDPDYADGVLRNTILPEFPKNLIHILATDFTARYVKILFDDLTNADGYLQYGYLMIARAFRPSINYGEGNAFAPEDSADVNESLGLKRVYFEHGIKRTLRLTFPTLDHDELFRDFTRLLVKSRTSRPVFVVPDPSDGLHLQNRSFLATLKQVPPIQQLLVDRGTFAVDFREL